MSERRAFSRIETYIRGQFRLAEPNEAPRYLSTYRSDSTAKNIMLATPNLPEPLVSYLCEIDTKLESAISFMYKNSIKSDFPDRLDVLEIGGGGMLFTTNRDLADGACLEAVLYLSEYPLWTVSAFGEIKRINLQDSNSVGKQYSFSFTRVHDDALESLIQFVFQEDLRRQRDLPLEDMF